MFRTIATAILFVPAFLLPAAAQDAELTVDQIVQKHTEALGGLDKLKAIQSMKATGKAVLMGGQMEAPITMQVKRPNSMRMDMTMQGKSFIQAFDGTTSWNINPFTGATEPQKANDEDTKTARDDSDFIDGSLVDYKTKGNAVESMGKEDVEGTAAYKLKITKKSGTVVYEYIDAQTFLPIKSSGKRKQAGQEFEFESYPSNFKAVNGVMLPFGLSAKMNGKALMQLSLENVEVNLAMDDAIFHMPEKPKEAKPKEDKK
jgi:outer membrane lipoprotein-sorting protein